MPESNRGYRLAALGAISALAIVALGAGSYFGALHAPHYGYQTTHPAYRGSPQEQGQIHQIDRDRAGLPYFAERIASGSDAKDRKEREDRDLAAQESMSVWAFWLLVISAVGTVAAIIGTFLLVWTLHETRQASRRELRAYLSFGDLGLSVFKSREVEGGVHLELDTSVQNGGATPAYDCVHLGNVLAFTEEEASRYFSRWNKAPRMGKPIPYTVHNGRDVPASIYASEDLTPAQMKAIQTGEKDLYAFGEVVYRDTFGYRRATRFCYTLASPLIPDQLSPSGVTTSRLTWGLAPFHNDAT